jgi:hypothetical protein
VEDSAVLTEAATPAGGAPSGCRASGCPSGDASAAAAAAVISAGPSRRAVLAASAAALPLLLTACKGVQSLGTPPPPRPDIMALRVAISAEELMVARYAAALTQLRHQYPTRVPAADLALRLAFSAVHSEHAAHLTQLKSRLVEPAGGAPTSSLSAGPAPTPGLTGPTGGMTAEVTVLAAAEQAASDRLIGQLGGLPPSLAQLFASIAASEATHVPYLQAARHGR